MSTFLAILLLAFSKSFDLHVLFKVLVSITTIGVGFGFLFTPAVLSLVGPPSLFRSNEEREVGEEALANRLAAGATAQGADGGRAAGGASDVESDGEAPPPGVAA